MKTIKVLSTAMLLSMVSLSSCSKDENSRPGNEHRAVTFKTSIDSQVPPSSRASNITWTANDEIGISMVANADRTIVDETTNRQYRTTTGTATGNFTAASAPNQIYFPEDGTSVDFIAYYPFRASGDIGASATAIGTYPVNVAVQADPEAIDLMWANTTTGFNETTVGDVPLVFDHQLVKLVMNCTAGSGLTSTDLEGMNVIINGMNTTQNFNLTTGALAGASTAQANFAPQTVTSGTRYEAIILPAGATTTAGQFNVTFTINPGTNPETFTWNMVAGTNFLTGNEYIYNVTISRIGVTASGTINPWTPGTSTGGGDVTAQ